MFSHVIEYIIDIVLGVIITIFITTNIVRFWTNQSLDELPQKDYGILRKPEEFHMKLEPISV